MEKGPNARVVTKVIVMRRERGKTKKDNVGRNEIRMETFRRLRQKGKAKNKRKKNKSARQKRKICREGKEKKKTHQKMTKS